MSLLVLGRNGQLATDLQQAAQQRGMACTALGRAEIDIGDVNQLLRAINVTKPSALINASGYTNVDGAESEGELAFKLNEAAPRAMAEAAAQAKLPFLHVSTDQVFDGTKQGAYTEEDKPNPINLYGRSKLGGEIAVQDHHPDALIVRVSWVWGPSGDNFVKKLLQWASARDELSIVADQIGRPTYSPALANALIDLAAMPNRPKGLLNYAGGDVMSRADQARRVLDASRAHGGPYAIVKDVPTSAFPTPAKRPLNAELAIDKVNALGVPTADFETELRDCIASLLQGKIS
ncbi:dTDP-4-dehydrorhamnose reductase [Rhizobiales bacterium TNE-4]|nr:dTDP-4-dehydrorhamnose reductase [Rhizobiales bacterium TNE-4]MBV1827554.1 dTDP-4-dehydrorhamnose reductase [Rhizobiales bacterium TNE-4]